MTDNPSLTDLGFTEAEILDLMMDVARHAAYQLAAQERGSSARELAAKHSVGELLGDARWRRLGAFAVDVLRGEAITATFDEKGPVVTLDEMSRLGALVLAQFLANEGKE